MQGKYGEELDTIVYGVFTTPPNSIRGSAVCSYRLRDISDAFAGQFKEQRSTSDNWLAVEPHRVPAPRPGTLVFFYELYFDLIQTTEKWKENYL